MKITYVLPSVGIAGGVLTVFETVNRLIQRGHEARIITLNNTSSKVSWYPYKGETFNLQDIYKLEHDIIVATHYITAFFVANLDIKAKKYYYIQHKESLFINEENLDNNIKNKKEFVNEYRNYIEQSYLLPLKHITTSKWLYDMSRKNFKQKPIRIKYGLNHDIFYPDPLFDKPQDKMRVLIEGTMQTTLWKGLKDAYEAIKKVKNIEVWTISADELSEENKKLIDKHWKAPSQDEIRHIYSSCDVLIKPSWYEGWGIGPMQAMACGCAIIITDNKGCKEYAKNNFNALIVPPKNPNAITKALEKIKDHKLRTKLIDNGLETMKKFQWDSEIDKLEKVFKEDLL